MRVRSIFPITAFLLGISGTAVAADQACQLKMLASVDTESDASGGMFLPGNFGSKRELLLVDTGGVFHELKEGVVKDLGLSTRRSDFGLVDVLGNRSSIVARAPDFAIGNMAPTSVDFVVTADNGLLGDERIAGVFFPGVYYRALDVDLDFVGHKFALLSQDHCAGGVVYWTNNGVAVVPYQLDNLHILFPVKVDGQELTAAMDSGASVTTMYTRAARRIGIDVDRPGSATEIGQLGDNPNVRTYAHRFRAIDIQGISISNPMVVLIPDLNKRSAEGPSTEGGRNDTRLSARHPTGPDILIGMSVLRHLHVYIAAGEHKLYITAGGAPAAAGAAPEPTAAEAQTAPH